MSSVPARDAEQPSRFRNVTVALLLAVVVVACVDVVVRLNEARLSGDVANKRSFAQVVAKASANRKGTLLAAVGSSLVENGVDQAVLRSSLANSGIDATVVKLAPDNSSIWDWTCVVEQRLLTQNPAPELLVIGFAWDQLSDRAPLIFRRNFNNLCPPSKLRDFAQFAENVDTEAWFDVAAVTTSKLFTHREPIRQRVFTQIVPHYKTVSQQLNERNNARVAEPVNSAAPGASGRTYRAAESLLTQLKTAGTTVVLVAMPVQDPYTIDRSVCEILGSKHRFLDMRNAVPADPSLYRDAIHLNERGAEIFSTALAARLSSSTNSISPCAS
jgi:hypothetical protein